MENPEVPKSAVERSLSDSVKAGKKKRVKRAHIIKWIREHPDVRLPRSLGAIVELTGCTRDAVKTYLFRQRRDARRVVDALPDLRLVPLILETTKGEPLISTGLDTYAISVDHWTAKAQIKGTFLGTPVVFNITHLGDFSRKVHEAYEQQVNLDRLERLQDLAKLDTSPPGPDTRETFSRIEPEQNREQD